MTPRESVVGFPFQNPWHSTRTESFTLSDELLQILNQQQRDLVQILRDLMRSCCYPTKSGPYLDRYGQFRPNLSGSGQISAPVIKREIDPNQPETKETRTEKSDQISGSVSGQIFIHLPHSSQVQVGHKPDPAQPVDSPTWRVSHVVQVFSTRVTTYILMFVRFQFNFSKYKILKSFTGWISKCCSMTVCVCKGIQKSNKEVLKKIFESVRRFIYTKDCEQVQGQGLRLEALGFIFLE